MLAVAVIAVASFVLHVIFNGRYGYFRDEFDYIICGSHPAWGYVDQPPLLPVLSRIFLAVFGDSLRSVRLMPALSASALIVLTGMIARELGGKRFAVALSAVTVLIAPIYLVRRKPAHHQLRSRSAALDGLRLFRDPRRKT